MLSSCTTEVPGPLWKPTRREAAYAERAADALTPAGFLGSSSYLQWGCLQMVQRLLLAAELYLKTA